MKIAILETVLGASMWAVLLESTLLISDNSLVIYCTFGGFVAALASIRIWKPVNHEEAVNQFLGNGILAFLFGPFATKVVCESLLPKIGFTYPVSFASALMVSGVVGLSATAIIKPLGPKIIKFVQDKVSSYFGGDKKPD